MIEGRDSQNSLGGRYSRSPLLVKSTQSDVGTTGVLSSCKFIVRAKENIVDFRYIELDIYLYRIFGIKIIA